MLLHRTKTVLPFRYAVVTYCNFFQCTFDKIEQKTGIKANTARKIIQKAIAQADCEDFH